MTGLITDRTQDNVNRRNLLAAKGWANMTEAEQAEWSGDPLKAADMNYNQPVNLFPYGPYYSDAVELIYRNTSVTATARYGGVYLYAVSIIGEAEKYAGKTFTLSLDSICVANSGAKPQIALYWHDDAGFEFAGASLTEAGSVTFTVSENTGNRAYLALYVYVTTDATVEAGTIVRYRGLMFEEGEVRHSYVPYSPILPTRATKGAYNYSDFNRVERATEEIGELLGLNLETKTDWGLWDIPKQADTERYLSNIVAIRNASPNHSSLPAPPGRLNGLNYESANVIEQILNGAYMVEGCLPRAGELFSGEV